MNAPDGTTRIGDTSASHTRPQAGARFVAGTVLAGRYRVVSLLGRGGMGEVYKADDLLLDHPVALKFLPDSLGLNPAALARFHGEVRIARQVSHPNVCRVHDVGEVDGLRFLSMEFIDGEDLSSLLRRIGRLPGDKAVQIARQLCAGLAAAHDAGVLHRDLKPANVMIDGRGQARLTDFGVAAVARDVRSSDGLAGTPAFMAPELLKGQDASVRSDIYALGLVLYELFTGRRAVEAASVAEAMLRHSSGSPVTTPSSWIDDIDPVAERAILRCLEAEPAARPASAIHVAAALPGGDPLQAALAAGETPSPEMVAAAAARSVMRPPAALTLLGAVAVVFVATLWLNDRQSISATLRSDLSIDVLVHRSREILGALGYADRLSDSASGLRFNVGYLRFDRTRAAAGRRQRLLADRPAAIEFWFRESPVPLVADMRPLVGGPPRVGPVSFDNPPRDARGMRSIVLDPRGRLLSFQAVPDEFDTRAAAAMNWDAVFAAAGLDRREFHDAEPTWTPPAASDERRAWTGAYAEWPDIPIRLEAAAYRGYLVGFRTLAPWDRVPPPDAAVGRGQFVGGFVYALSIAGLVLAWWNLRLGRGDKRGAYRLGVFILIASVIEWLLKVDHVAGAGEMQLFRLGLGTALVQAVSAYVVYLALEPHLRRRWPEALITWSRVIGGRFSDAAVGRDVLIGLALAGIAAVVWTLAAWWFGRTTDADLVLANALSARRGLGTLVATMANAVFISVFVCFFALLMRLLFRNTIAAALAAWVPWLLLGLVSAVDGQAFSPIVTGTFGVVSTFAVFRYGLLAVTTVIATQTLDPMFRAWVAWHGLPGGGFVLALIVGVGAWACYLAIGSPAVVPRRQGGLGISDGASSG